jgi:hypothetical protein
VILPFSRLVTPEEYQAIWAALAPNDVDQAPKDPSRFWFMPGSPSEHTFEARWMQGDPLDPDAILAQAKTVAPATAPVYRPPPREVGAEERASAYLAKMPPAISGSGGHTALWQAALALVRGFGLNETTAFAMLMSEYNPRCQPPWRERELVHKVRDAANAAKVPFGYKLDEDRDWRRTPASVPRPDPDAQPVEPRPAHPGEEDASTGQPDASADPIQAFGVRSVAELLNGVLARCTTEKPIGGFRRGMVTVLGAPTSWGKSSLAILAAEACLAAGKRVLLVSGEDTDDTYGARIMSRRARVNAVAIRDNKVTPDDVHRMMASLNDAEADPFFVNGIGKPAEKMGEAIRLICAKRDLDLVIVDYLQAFSCTRRCPDRRVEVTHIARTFIEAIKVSGSSGLILSQLKRMEDNKRPDMHDLKESGDLENMAEHVIIGSIQRPKEDADTKIDEWRRFIAVEKNKDGPRLSSPLELEFEAATASFTGMTVYNGRKY